MSPVDPAQFRRLLGRFATGVTVLTTGRGDRRVGMTATSLASVSLDPPLLLVCLSRDCDLLDALSRTSRFAVNVLAADQEWLSRRFASDEEDRFEGVPLIEGPGDLPLLEGAAAHIICDRWDVKEAGDHVVVFGQVVGGEAFPPLPLLHHDGSYTTTRDQP